jgi:TetR/AcrR family transcriptional regulator
MTPRPSRTEDSRHAILRAAIEEFAEQGESGGRTDAIARAAGVNKALIHYYFGTKEALYAAVLEEVFRSQVGSFLSCLTGSGTAGERLLRHFLDHFDHLAAAGSFTRLMAHEMMRARAGETAGIPRLVDLAFGPLHGALVAALAEGMASGELRVQEPGPLILSLTGSNVFYFVSAPVFREIAGKDPRDPEMLARQRKALLDLAATVLFADPDHGRAVAARIHAEQPLFPTFSRGASQ